eukprot:12402997-Karenia_brevis.AAC.1
MRMSSSSSRMLKCQNLGSRKIRSRRSLLISFLALQVMTHGVLEALMFPGRDDMRDFALPRKSGDMLLGGKVLLVQGDIARCGSGLFYLYCSMTHSQVGCGFPPFGGGI